MRNQTSKKAFSVALALIMGISLCSPVAANAASSEKKDTTMAKYLTAKVNQQALGKMTMARAKTYKKNGFKYKVSGGKATITGYTGKSKKLAIPAKLGNKTVTKIGKYAFDDNDKLKSVTIPKTVTEIQEGAFRCCYNLTSVKLGNKVTKIGERAFERCNVKKLQVAGKVKKMESYVMAYNWELSKVSLPSTVTTLAYRAFYCCTNLSKINLDKVKEADGTSLRQTKWFEKQKTGAYVGTTFLGISGNPESLTIKPGTTKIADFACDYSDYGLLEGTSKLQKVVIPEGVTYIGEAAFYNVPVKEITIPASVTKLAPLSIGFVKFDNQLEYDVNYFYNLELEKQKTAQSKRRADESDYDEEESDEYYEDEEDYEEEDYDAEEVAWEAAWKAYEEYEESEKVRLGAKTYDFRAEENPAIRTTVCYGVCVPVKDFVIKGQAGSAAETYAKQYGFTFVAE